MDYPLDKIMSVSKVAAQSKFFPNMPVEAIAMIGIVAYDLQLPLSTALMGGINIIQGKPSLSARIMNLLIRRAGHSMTVENKPDACIIRGKRKDNGDEATVSFSMEDARAAGLVGKDNWKKHGSDMLFSRALSRIARQLFPDCIEGAYVEGEIESNDSKKSGESNDGANVVQLQCNSGVIDVPPIEEPLITQDQFEIITAKARRLIPGKEEEILKAKGWTSWKEMKQKQFDPCMKFLEDEIKKELDKELNDKAPWEES